MYMLRPYQPSTAGTDVGPQWRKMPSLASRNQSGHLYCFRDSQVGSNVCGVRGAAKSAAAVRTRAPVTMAAIMETAIAGRAAAERAVRTIRAIRALRFMFGSFSDLSLCATRDFVSMPKKVAHILLPSQAFWGRTTIYC